MWNGEDLARAMGSLFQGGTGNIPKYVDLPLANYATLPFDKVVKDGQTVGLSTYTAYTYNERAMLSLGCINQELSAPGTQVTLVWGEEGGGSTQADRRAPRAGDGAGHGGAGALRTGGARGVPAEVSVTDAGQSSSPSTRRAGASRSCRATGPRSRPRAWRATASATCAYHGGPDRAVCLYSFDRIRALQEEGHHVSVGLLGENLTVMGLDWRLLTPGTRVQVGGVRLLLTAFAVPCKNLSRVLRRRQDLPHLAEGAPGMEPRLRARGGARHGADRRSGAHRRSRRSRRRGPPRRG